MPVTLIKVFSVPKGKEDEFVKWWQDVKALSPSQQGFISGKFHKSIKPESKFNFILGMAILPSTAHRRVPLQAEPPVAVCP